MTGDQMTGGPMTGGQMTGGLMTGRCGLAEFLTEGGPRRVPFQLCCVIGLVERDEDRLGCAAGLGLETLVHDSGADEPQVGAGATGSAVGS
jgi:hypothetical protein